MTQQQSIRALFKKAAKEREIQNLLTSVTGRERAKPDFSSPAIPGRAELGDAVRLKHNGLVYWCDYVGNNFIGITGAITYTEIAEGDYEVIRKARSGS